MPRTTEPCVRIATAALLFGLAGANLPGGEARAVDDCLTAPNAPPPQGSHWYYRTERAKARKCWYLGPKGPTVRHTAPQIDSPTALPTSSANTADRQMLPSVPGKPTSNAATPSDAEPNYEHSERSGQLTGFGTSAFVSWPDPQPVASTSRDDADIRGARAAANGHDREARDEAPQQQAHAAAPTADLIHPESVRSILLLLFVASAAVIGGSFLNAVVKIAVASRRRVFVDPGRIDRHMDFADDYARSIFSAPRQNDLARPPSLSKSPHDETLRSNATNARLRQILRELEQRAA